MRSVLITATVAALMVSTSVTASFCPANEGIYHWTQKIYGNSNQGNDTSTWFMSPCTKMAPSGHDTPVYLAKSEGLSFERVELTGVINNWASVNSNNGLSWYQANFSSNTWGTAVWGVITVQCNNSMGRWDIEGVGKVRDWIFGSQLHYILTVKMNCDGSGTWAPSTAVPADCSQYSGCHSCTNSNSGTCGWCANSLTCEGGTSSGPNAGNCPNSWEWVTSQCTTPVPTTPVPPTPAPANCGQYTTCSDCTNSNSGTCGFCGATKQCESGTSNGPNMGTCPNWRWVANQCI